MLGELIQTAGFVLAIGGFVVEGLGVIAMISYPVRRRLPSPFALQTFGFIAFLVGLVVIGLGRWVG